MGRPLFGMSDAELDNEYQRHVDRLYDRYFCDDTDEECCENCDHWLSGTCFEHSDDDDNYIETEADYYCDDYRPREDDY